MERLDAMDEDRVRTHENEVIPDRRHAGHRLGNHLRSGVYAIAGTMLGRLPGTMVLLSDALDPGDGPGQQVGGAAVDNPRIGA